MLTARSKKLSAGTPRSAHSILVASALHFIVPVQNIGCKLVTATNE